MRRMTMIGAVLALLLGGGLSVAAPRAEERSSQRLSALQRWNTQSLTNYRIFVVASVLGSNCAQELDVRGGTVVTTLHDTCNRTWLGPFTVERLFAWSERMESAPECAPSRSDCVCRWVRVGAIDYHAQLGYPKRIDMRRDVQANPFSLGYWKRVISTRSFATCNPTNRRFQIAVVSLTTLP